MAMVAPTVELIAREDLHPALTDLLIEAARDSHGRATLFQRAGEFPAPIEHVYPLSPDAARYCKSGKSFIYGHLPFWLASLTNRILAVLVPIVIVLIPGLRLYIKFVRERLTAATPTQVSSDPCAGGAATTA